jgi:hypothetical protein
MRTNRLKIIGSVFLVTVLSGCGAEDESAAEDVDVVTGEATKWYCGSQCNGKKPNWVVPSNGVQCSRSAVRLATGHPTALDGQADAYMTVTVYYSTVCETMWATATNSRAIGRTWCDIRGERLISPYYHYLVDCPSAGTSVTTIMIDDHHPRYDDAAWIELDEATATKEYFFTVVY